MTTRTLFLTIALLAAATAAGGAAAAAPAADTPAVTVTVHRAPALHAGQLAPFDAPGVRAVRRGKPIPAGYALVGFTVDVARAAGAPNSGAALRFRCPQATRLRTFGVTGHAGFSATRDYVGHRQTQILSFGDGRRMRSTGTIYAVCR